MKRLISSLLAILLIISLIPLGAFSVFANTDKDIQVSEETQESENTYFLGDSNNDGKINIVDSCIIQRYLVDLYDGDENFLKRASIINDSEPTIQEVTLIQKYIAHIPTDYDDVIKSERKYKEYKTVYFTNNNKWDTVSAYYWKTESKSPKEWPGYEMTYVGDDEHENKKYSIEIPADVDNIIFNDTEKNNQQTVDVKIADELEFYLTGNKTNDEKWEVASYSVEPTTEPITAASTTVEPTAESTAAATTETIKYEIELTCEKFCCGEISISYPDSLKTSISDINLADVIGEKFNEYVINAETKIASKPGYKTVDINFTYEKELITNEFKDGTTFLTIEFSASSDEKPKIDKFDIYDVAQVVLKEPQSIALTAIASYNGKEIETITHIAPVDPSTETESTEPSSETTPEKLEDGYYLSGILNGENHCDVFNIDSKYMLKKNENINGEYILDWNFCEKDEIRVVKIEKGYITKWYKDQSSDAYTIDSAHKGEKTLHFRPEGNTQWTYTYFDVLSKTEPITEPTEGPVYNITNTAPIGEKTKNNGYIGVKDTAYAGDKVEVTVYPSEGCSLNSIYYVDENGKTDINKDEDGKYIFTMPQSDISIKAEFMPTEYMLGDSNDNKMIDINDVTMIQLLLAKIIEDDGFLSQRAGIIEEGNPTIADATLLQRYLAKITTDYDDKIGQEQKYETIATNSEG